MAEGEGWKVKKENTRHDKCESRCRRMMSRQTHVRLPLGMLTSARRMENESAWGFYETYLACMNTSFSIDFSKL